MEPPRRYLCACCTHPGHLVLPLRPWPKLLQRHPNPPHHSRHSSTISADTVVVCFCASDFSAVASADEIKAAYVLTKKAPRRNEMVRRVAMVGGFLARKGDGEPGVKTIWLGLQYVRNFVAGMQFMRDAEGAKSCV